MIQTLLLDLLRDAGDAGDDTAGDSGLPEVSLMLRRLAHAVLTAAVRIDR